MRSRALLTVVALTLSACGGGGDDDGGEAAVVDETTTTAAAGDSPASSPDSTVVEGDEPSSTTSTPTTAAASSGGGGEASVAPTPLAPGTYRYRQSGSASGGGQTYDAPPEGTLVVDPPEADGRQLTHRYIDPEGEPNDTQLRFGADGIFLLQTVLRQGQTEIACTFDPPLPTPPWPPSVGATYAGNASCSGGLTVEVTGSITGTRQVELDGQQHEAFVLESTITTSGQVQSETKQTDWFVASLRMSVHTDSTTTGRFGQVAFESNGTSDLISARPS